MPDSYSHTLSVKRSGRSVHRCCSFKSIPLNTGQQWQVHKGYIMDSLTGKRPVVVKCPQNVQSGGNQVGAEMEKFQFVESVLSTCGTATSTIQVVPTFYSQIDKIGKLCKLQKKGKHCLCKGWKVLVQDFVEGDIETLFALDKGRLNSSANEDARDKMLIKLVHKSYVVSNGQCVISELKGVKAARSDESGQATYTVTSVTIYSRDKRFGETDKGTEGIALYENWGGKDPADRITPTAPPQCYCDTNFSLNTNSPPMQKFRVYPVLDSKLENSKTSSLSRNSSLQFLDTLDSGLDLYKDLIGKIPQLRKVLSERCLTKLWGLPPSYSFTGA